MDAEPPVRQREWWTPSRGVGLVLAAVAGFGAVGIASGLGALGGALRLHAPIPVDLSGPIVMAPVVIITGYAAAVLRTRGAAVAATIGAVAAPIAAAFTVGDCVSNTWALVGLAGAAIVILILASISSAAGAWIGRQAESWHASRRSGANVAAAGVAGVLTWLVAVSRLFACA